MFVVLMKNLVIELTKLAVKTETIEPATTVLNCLIDFVGAQITATQGKIEKVEAKIDDLHKNSFLVGQRNLVDAKKVSDVGLRKDRITKALDAFIQASQYTQISDPLIPLRAKFSAGACYELLVEREAALDYYEEAFREAKAFEKVLQEGHDRQDAFDTILGLFSSPLDTLDDLIERSGKDYKTQQQLFDILIKSKDELEGFIDNLLTLIVARKGVSREEYLQPWAPKKKSIPDLFNQGTAMPFLARKPLLTNSLRTTGSSLPTASSQSLICPKCHIAKVRKMCPKCLGAGKIFSVGGKCQICNGSGYVYTCNCKQPVNLLPSSTRWQGRKQCRTCGGTGSVTTPDGKKKTCPVCFGSGTTLL